MMNRKEFQQYLLENVKDYLPESFADARITFNEVVKNNDNHMMGMSIVREGEGVVPNIYIDGFYQQYQEGRKIDEIVGDIADARIEHDSQIQAEEITHNLMNYEIVKDKLEICICDTEENREHLQGLVHTEHGDFSATYHVRISEIVQDGLVASAAVTPQFLEVWGISLSQLHQDALKSDIQKTPQFVDMIDMMESLMTGENPKNLLETGEKVSPDGMGMYCLTNSERMDGASLILQDGLMQQIEGIVGGNFYVLPSSIHEVMVVPDNGQLELRELSAMVYNINRTEVDPQDRLSDSVQYYDAETRTLENAQNREGRKALEKSEKMIAKESKKGIHDRLSKKKAETKATPKAEKAMEKAAKKNQDMSI